MDGRESEKKGREVTDDDEAECAHKFLKLFRD